MTRTTLIWATAGLGLVLALTTTACGDGDEAAPAPGEETAKPAPTPAPTPEPTPAPTPDPAPTQDAVELAGDPALGATVYANFCATCHGASGAGDGPLSSSLPVRPANHSDGAYMNTLTDAYLVQVVTEGGPAVGKDAMMAPWGTTLSPGEIADVVAFVRTLADPPYVAPTSD